MKISELIQHLEKIKEHSGDGEITISVRDYYSRYGSPASLFIETTGGIWTGVHTVRNGDNIYTLIDAHIDDYKDFDGTIKHPKITFRK